MTDPTPDGRVGRIVGVGASAGGVTALQTLVHALPPRLAGAIVVVVHIPATARSRLPEILTRAGPMTAVHAREEGADIAPGTVYVAPPDHHVVVDDGRVRATDGPRVNGQRPAIDALLDSLATRGGDAMGVILSGTRDDGVAGLAAVRAAGGAALVQDPDEALYPQLPAHASAVVGEGDVLRLDAIARRITHFLQDDGAPSSGAAPSRAAGLGDAVGISCPDCGGNLFEIPQRGSRLSCRVGHEWSPSSLLGAQADSVERALWTARNVLEERAALKRRLAAAAEHSGRDASARQFRENAGAVAAEARIIDELLTRIGRAGMRLEESP